MSLAFSASLSTSFAATGQQCLPCEHLCRLGSLWSYHVASAEREPIANSRLLPLLSSRTYLAEIGKGRLPLLVWNLPVVLDHANSASFSPATLHQKTSCCLVFGGLSVGTRFPRRRIPHRFRWLNRSGSSSPQLHTIWVQLGQRTLGVGHPHSSDIY